MPVTSKRVKKKSICTMKVKNKKNTAGTTSDCDLVINTIMHKCCDNCKVLCECEDCTEQQMIASDVQQISLVVAQKTSAMIEANLHAYFEAENKALLQCIW
jgi:hypothetical protein